MDSKRLPRCVGNAVKPVPGWKDAAVYREAQFKQNLECPERACGNRKAGSAIGAHPKARCVFDSTQRTPGIGAEFVGSQLVHQAVGIAMTSQFMPRRLNRSDDGRVALRDPTQNKKGTVETEFLQQFKHSVSVSLNPRLHMVPLGVGDQASKGRDVEVVLDVDCQRIRTRSVHAGIHRNWSTLKRTSLAGPGAAVGKAPWVRAIPPHIPSGPTTL